MYCRNMHLNQHLQGPLDEIDLHVEMRPSMDAEEGLTRCVRGLLAPEKTHSEASSLQPNEWTELSCPNSSMCSRLWGRFMRNYTRTQLLRSTVAFPGEGCACQGKRACEGFDLSANERSEPVISYQYIRLALPYPLMFLVFGTKAVQGKRCQMPMLRSSTAVPAHRTVETRSTLAACCTVLSLVFKFGPCNLKLWSSLVSSKISPKVSFKHAVSSVPQLVLSSVLPLLRIDPAGFFKKQPRDTTPKERSPGPRQTSSLILPARCGGGGGKRRQPGPAATEAAVLAEDFAVPALPCEAAITWYVTAFGSSTDATISLWPRAATRVVGAGTSGTISPATERTRCLP